MRVFWVVFTGPNLTVWARSDKPGRVPMRARGGREGVVGGGGVDSKQEAVREVTLGGAASEGAGNQGGVKGSYLLII